MAIHKTNHWLFLKVNQLEVSIFDSMRQSRVKNYLDFPLIRKIV